MTPNFSTTQEVTWCPGCNSKLYKFRNCNIINIHSGDLSRSPDDCFSINLFLEEKNEQ